MLTRQCWLKSTQNVSRKPIYVRFSTEVLNRFLLSHVVLFLWFFVSQNFITVIFISCLAQSYWILYRWLTNVSFWFPMDSRLIYKPFCVNLSPKHFSKNSLCDKDRIFFFLIRARRNISFFISSLLIFLPCLFCSGVWLASVLLSSMKLVWYTESTLSVWSKFLTNQILLFFLSSDLYILLTRQT